MSRLLALVWCACAVTALAHCAAVPTQDTLVVTRSDDAATTEYEFPTPELTTKSPTLPIKLTEMNVISEISLRYAHTAVVARVRNPANRAQEAHFRVLLPETAFISGFVMTLDGKSYKAYVKEKEEAKQIYQDAVDQGYGAAHISTSARNSNQFTVIVNVEPLTKATFNLTYEELLVRRNGVYNHAINLHPGALVPNLTLTVHIKETEKITELRVPEMRTGNEIDATKDDALNTKVSMVRSNDEHEATITFTPDLQEQERLMKIYTKKSKGLSSLPEEKEVDGVLGQFVVQYDVARSKHGEVLVNDGYFVHFFAPENLKPLNKYVVFVLDTSSSMWNRKIAQLREAMQTILGELNPGDYFSIVEFSTRVRVRDLRGPNDAEVNSPPSIIFPTERGETRLIPPSAATEKNIERAKTIVSELRANGGTNIDQAFEVATALINKGVDVPFTAAKNANAKTLLEPIIIFLTDGEPTVGEIYPERIINNVREWNSGPNKATIFTLAFGDYADRVFLRKISLHNGGFMRHIYEAGDAVLQLQHFYRQISSPLLANIEFAYPAEQVKAESVTLHEFRTYYGGSELVVAGELAPDVDEFTPDVIADCGVKDGYGREEFESRPKVKLEKELLGYLPLERLWSYLTIKQLLDKRVATDSDENKNEVDSLQRQALDLALKYEFVTPLTSLVVVKPNATSEVNTEAADKGQLFIDPTPVDNSKRAQVYTTILPDRPWPVASHSDSSDRIFSGSSQKNCDLDIRFEGVPLHLSPASSTRLPPTPMTSGLSTLNLEKYEWVKPLLTDQEDAILLYVNDTTVTLKLVSTAGGEVPTEADGDAKCGPSVANSPGVCVYLSRCLAAINITSDLYMGTYCNVSQGYAGVCCPQNEVIPP